MSVLWQNAVVFRKLTDRKEWKFPRLPITVAKVTSTEKQVDFRFQVTNDGKTAAAFVLRTFPGALTFVLSDPDMFHTRR